MARECTLLELIQSVNALTDNDDEVVATVTYLVNTGRVRLCGNFAGAKIGARPSFNTFLSWVQPHSPQKTKQRSRSNAL
jgi:hypothetical protein